MVDSTSGGLVTDTLSAADALIAAGVTGSSAKIYTADDVSISGQGVTNGTGVASNFMIYGTAADSFDRSGDEVAAQSISVSGNGVLSAAVYAPNADVTVKGGGNSGQIYGGVVGFTATMNGNGAFHFDEALKDIQFGGGNYTILSWLEMNGETDNSKRKDLASL